MMESFILFIRILLASSSAFTNAQTALGPLVVIALMLDALIVIIWYFIGSLLNNSKVKGAAAGEFNQFIGTVILVGILLGALTTLSSVYYSAISATNLMSPTAISTMCTNIESSSQLDLLGSKNSFLSGPSSSTGNFPGLCSFVSSSSISSLTDKLNYPLAASAVVVANLTNQTAANLNYSFTMDAWLGFLQQLRPTIGVCIDPKDEGAGCLIPNPVLTPTFYLKFSYDVDAGYSLIIKNFAIIGTLLNLSVESFIVQLFFIAIFLYTWPWLLFGGIILRGTLFTRRLGGLLIAIAISGLLVYPTIFAIEYTSLGNGFSQSATGGNYGGVPSAGTGTGTSQCNSNTIGYNSTYGFCSVTALPGTPSGTWPLAGTPTGNYVVNFFVEPNIKAIAWSYQCWPNIYGHVVSVASYTGVATGLLISTSGLLGAEGVDIAQLVLPVVSAITSLVGGIAEFVNGYPTQTLFVNCQPSAALETFFAMLNAWGIIGLVSYFIPLINIVITMSSVVGLSQLFGGDTDLAGLAKIL